MIKLVQGLPDNVVGIVADGHITAEDYSNTLIPALEAKLKQHEKVRIYYEIGGNFSGIDFGATFSDLRVGVGHLLRWERIALVTDIDWIRYGTEFFGFMMPAQVKVFTAVQSQEAKDWIAG